MIAKATHNILINQSQSDFLRTKYCVVLGPGTYSINPAFEIECPAMISGGISSHWPGRMGSFSYSWSHISRYVDSIGRYCSLAPNITFGDWEHKVDWLTTSNVVWDAHHPSQDFMRMSGCLYQFVRDPNHNDMRKISIGNDVWIGSNVYIRQGIKIGDGAIIGRGTNVTKDVPPYAIVAGNPGRVKKFRFSEKLIERLLSFEWWRFSFSDFEGVDCSNPEESLDCLQFLIESNKLIAFKPSIFSFGGIAQMNP